MGDQRHRLCRARDVDGEFWGFDVYWNRKPVAIRFQRANGKMTMIDLPDVATTGDTRRFYIGRPLVLG